MGSSISRRVTFDAFSYTATLVRSMQVGRTMLHMAFTCKHLDVALTLIQSHDRLGIDVDIPDEVSRLVSDI